MTVHSASVRNTARAPNFFHHALLAARNWEPQVWIPAGAVAAGIAIGVFISGWFSTALIQNSNGALIARGELADVLSARIAGEPPGSSIRMGLSFADHQGNFCRIFEIANALSGIACHEQNRWKVVATEEPQPESTGQFRSTAPALPAGLQQAVNEMISGPPLNAAAERDARSHNWTP
jgi:hypothetical protein